MICATPARRLPPQVVRPSKALMQRMGHTTVVAAMRYQHVIDGQQDAIAEYLDVLARGATMARDAPAPLDVSGTLVARNGHSLDDEDGENSLTRDYASGAEWNRTIDLVLIRDAL